MAQTFVHLHPHVFRVDRPNFTAQTGTQTQTQTQTQTEHNRKKKQNSIIIDDDDDDTMIQYIYQFYYTVVCLSIILFIGRGRRTDSSLNMGTVRVAVYPMPKNNITKK